MIWPLFSLFGKKKQTAVPSIQQQTRTNEMGDVDQEFTNDNSMGRSDFINNCLSNEGDHEHCGSSECDQCNENFGYSDESDDSQFQGTDENGHCGDQECEECNTAYGKVDNLDQNRN
jgi:hypothetical protein